MNKLEPLRKLLFLLVSCIVICMSCYNDKDEYIPDIKVYAFYEAIEQPGVKIPDVGAEVYLYYRVCKEDFTSYTYQGEGIFMKGNLSEFKPDVKHVIDESGSLSFIPEYMNENATIVIESSHYKGQFDLTSFSSTMNGAGFYKVFKP